jgi:hypothetical protein
MRFLVACFILIFTGCTFRSTPPSLSEHHVDLEYQRLFVDNSELLPITRLFLTAPERSQAHAQGLAESLLVASREQPSFFLPFASRSLGVPVHTEALGSSVVPWRKDFHGPDTLSALLRKRHATGDLARLAALPREFQEIIYVILRSEEAARLWIKRARASFPPDLAHCFWEQYDLMPAFRVPQDDRLFQCDLPLRQAIGKFDLRSLLFGAQKFTVAAEWARQALEPIKALSPLQPSEVISISTDEGKIILSGKSAQSIPADEAILSVDFGGDDTYTSAGVAVRSRPLASLSFDLGGNDTYKAASEAKASFGSGIFGVGILWDSDGSDRYEGAHLSQGAGLFGVGVLIDEMGDDEYLARDRSQGFGFAGVGILVDRLGSDRFQSATLSQGSGGPRSTGILVDLAGNDSYRLIDDQHSFRAHQERSKGNSMGQGTGFGLRGDTIHGVSLAGGFGTLIEGGGNDTYNGDIFVQGASFWLGAGLLVDQGGNDSYTAYWYGQGAAAHFGGATFLDMEGNDSFHLTRQSGLGLGHDLALGTFIDLQGDDTYPAPPFSLGTSSAAGNGVFLDFDGIDNYPPSAERNRGWVDPIPTGELRGLAPGHGLYFDSNQR